MTALNKQALREAAEKADSGEWSYEEFNRPELPGGSFVKIDGRDAVYCLNKPVGGIKQSRAVIAFIAAFNPKVALALLDENLQLQREKDAIEAVALALRDDMRQAHEKLEAAENNLIDSECHVAELEESLRDKQAVLETAEKRITDYHELISSLVGVSSSILREVERMNAAGIGVKGE
ncbi:ead/Ea22-like family protein [Salmonella enterica]|nr:ead/Ea22-like family protein [Salmonella enterica]